MNKSTKSLVLLALVVLICIINVQAIFVNKKIKLKGSSKFMFLKKFAIGEELYGTLRIRFRFVSPYLKYIENQDTLPVAMFIHKYNGWDQSLLADPNDCYARRNHHAHTHTFNVPLNGEWTQEISISLQAGGQTQVHYVSVDDCDNRLWTVVPDLPKMEYELYMDNDGSHFSQEDFYILPFYLVMFTLFTFFLGKTILEFYREFKSEESVENPLLPLILSMNADLMHLGLMSIHLFFMYWDGSGFFVLSVFARLFKIISQATMMWLLITIAYGWTVTYKNMQESDIYILSAIFVIMIHLLIAALTYIDDEEHHKYHDFGGVQGVILMVLRLIIFAAFVYGIKETGKKANNKQKDFLWNLTFSASFYIL